MSKLDAEQAASAVLTVGLGLPQLRQVPGVIDLLRAAEHVVVSQLSSYPPKLIRAFLACFARGVYIRCVCSMTFCSCLEEMLQVNSGLLNVAFQNGWFASNSAGLLPTFPLAAHFLVHVPNKR